MSGLAFGNPEQIAILRRHQADKIAEEKRLEENKHKPMKTFEVEIEISGTQYLTIEAVDKESAEKEAKEDFELSETDYDIDYVRVTEYKQKETEK